MSKEMRNKYSYLFGIVLYFFSEILPPVSSVPGGGAQHCGGALVGPSL